MELKCPTDNIPTELIVDLDGVDIGQSFKISSIKLPENVHPTIQGMGRRNVLSRWLSWGINKHINF